MEKKYPIKIHAENFLGKYTSHDSLEEVISSYICSLKWMPITNYLTFNIIK